MKRGRLSKEERKAAIVQAALPLFARQGFSNTTTKQLAHAAQVSEALLYKHFPSKESLYEEIKGFGSHHEDAPLRELMSREPSTVTLIAIVYNMMRRFISGFKEAPLDWETRTRLFLHSCLEDGSFLEFLFKNRMRADIDRVMENVRAARRSGDLVDANSFLLARMLFVHQLAVMLAGLHLPGRAPLDYECTREELVHEATLFALRGLGMRDEVIRREFKPRELALSPGAKSR